MKLLALAGALALVLAACASHAGTNLPDRQCGATLCPGGAAAQ